MLVNCKQSTLRVEIRYIGHFLFNWIAADVVVDIDQVGVAINYRAILSHAEDLNYSARASLDIIGYCFNEKLHDPIDVLF